MIHDMSPPTTSLPLYTDHHVNDMSHYVIVADEAHFFIDPVTNTSRPRILGYIRDMPLFHDT